MRFQLNTITAIGSTDTYLLPAAGNATTDDRLFVVCDNESIATALTTAIGEYLAQRRKISIAEFSAMLDDAMPAAGERLKTCNLALALFQSNGCLVAQMGRSRVLHCDSEGEVSYDSRNQLIELGAKARTELIRRFMPGDFLALVLTDRVNPSALAGVVNDSELDDEHRHNAIATQLSRNHDTTPAAYVVTMAGGSGRRARLGKISTKWMVTCIVLAALGALAWAMLTGHVNLPKLGGSSEAVVDTLSVDTAVPPADTTATPADTTTEVPTTEPPTAVAPSAAPVTKPAPKPEHTVANEPAASSEPAHEPLRPGSNVVPEPVSAPALPATPEPQHNTPTPDEPGNN